MVFVRWRAWWFNKVPLSITFYLLLIDGSSLGSLQVAGFLALVVTICAGSNFAYALNDLYDREEDFKSGKANAATAMGTSRIWTIICISAALAIVLPAISAGIGGVILSVGVLLLPLAYSIPPFRIKERKWLGILSDALAAHVAPAALALLIVTHLTIRPVYKPMALSALGWALAVGLRGILSHQVHTVDKDTAGGLRTVVHDFGPHRVVRGIVAAILPIEVLAFGIFIGTCKTGPVVWGAAALFLAYEVRKTLTNPFPTTAFRAHGQPYIPFVDEAFYKAWGPVVVALDAAALDLAYLALIPDYILLFRPHLVGEYRKIVAVCTNLPRLQIRLIQRRA